MTATKEKKMAKELQPGQVFAFLVLQVFTFLVLIMLAEVAITIGVFELISRLW